MLISSDLLRKISKTISCILVVCLLVANIQVMTYGANEGITITSYQLNIIKSDNKVIEITETGTFLVVYEDENNPPTRTPISDDSNEIDLCDGDRIETVITWVLDDSEDGRYFEIDFNSLISNIKIVNNMTPKELFNDKEYVGDYIIEDGVLKVTFLDGTNFINGDNRKGGMTLSGEIDLDDNTIPDGDKITVQIGTLKKELPYNEYAVINNIKLRKETQGNPTVATNANGNKILQQKYKVELSSQQGNFLINNIEDIFGGGIQRLSNVVVKENSISGISLDVGSEYTWEQFQNELANKYVNEGEKIVIEYTADVSTSVYNQSADYADYKNTIKLSYNNEATPITSDAYIGSINKPTVSKSGIISESNGRKGITWTISVDLNDFDSMDWDAIVKSITDKLGEGLVNSGTAIELNKEKFTDTDNDGIYTYEYFTEVIEDYWNGSVSKSVENIVDVVLDYPDYGTFTYSGKGTVSIDGIGWISKEVADYDSSSKTISWRIKLDNIPQNIKNVKVEDWVDNWNSALHSISDTNISVETGNNTTTIVSNGTFVENNGVVNSYYSYGTSYGELSFDDSFIASVAGSDVYINVTSKITDSDMSKTFVNVAKLKYIEIDVAGNEKNGEYSAEASFRDPSQCITKEGIAVAGENSIDYTVMVNISNLDIEDGKNIVLKDSLPEGMVLNGLGDGSVICMLADQYNSWLTITNKSVLIDSNNVMTITVPTDEIYDIWADNKDTTTFYIKLQYRTDVENEAEFTTAGNKVTYTNNITGKYYGTGDGIDIGSATSSVDLTPQSIVSKLISDKSDLKSKHIISYQIDINENELELSSGDKVVGKDVLGIGLEYIFDTIKVEVKDANGTTQTLTLGTDYSYEYSTDNNSLTFTLPDAKHLIITYDVRVNINSDYYENYYLQNSSVAIATNEFTLEGVSGDAGKGQSVLPQVELNLDDWTEKEYGDITLYKYHNDVSMELIGGAVFDLYVVEVVNGQLGKETIVKSDIGKGDMSGKYSITGLNKDTLYVLYEITAPNGFAKIDSPFYFVLPGENAITLPNGLNIRYLNNGSELYYENVSTETLPDEPTAPEETTAPEEPTTPEETTAPEETTTPEEPTTSEETTTPEETTAPDETTTPEETTAPGETTAPEETTSSSPTEPETEVSDETEPETEPETPNSPENPDTGDRGVGIYLITMLISLMIVLVAYLSKKIESEEV